MKALCFFETPWTIYPTHRVTHFGNPDSPETQLWGSQVSLLEKFANNCWGVAKFGYWIWWTKTLAASVIPFSLSAGDCLLDKEIGYKVLDWTYLPQNSDIWRALVNTNVNMSDPLNSENFLTTWTTISFSGTLGPFSVQNIVFRIIITIRDWHNCG
jgi:hypothetical protein